MNLAKQEGVELTDEQLAAISGGFCNSSDLRWRCPSCDSSDTEVWNIYDKGTSMETPSRPLQKMWNEFHGQLMNFSSFH